MVYPVPTRPVLVSVSGPPFDRLGRRGQCLAGRGRLAKAVVCHGQDRIAERPSGPIGGLPQQRLPQPADRKLYLLIVGHVVRVNEGTPGALAHLEVEVLGEHWREVLQGRRDAYERAFRDIVAEGIAAGIFRGADSRIAARMILGAVNWTVRWFRPEGGKSAGEIGREAAELMVRGLLAPGAELAAPPAEAPMELAELEALEA